MGYGLWVMGYGLWAMGYPNNVRYMKPFIQYDPLAAILRSVTRQIGMQRQPSGPGYVTSFLMHLFVFIQSCLRGNDTVEAVSSLNVHYF
jgi:hypothetical protein